MMKNELLPIRFCIIVDHSGVPPAPSRASARPLRLLPRVSHAPYLPRLHRRAVPIPASSHRSLRAPLPYSKVKEKKIRTDHHLFHRHPQLVISAGRDKVDL